VTTLHAAPARARWPASHAAVPAAMPAAVTTATVRGLRQHGRTALAQEVEESMVGLVERSGFREYFDPFTGEGYGSPDFSWTAALFIDLLESRTAPKA